MKNRITSKKITKLKKNEIVLVGTNSKGNHAGGFAKFCKEKLKLKEGISRGISGQCYAIDTMSGIEVIKEQIQPFIEVAKVCPKKTFLVTLIGTGIAGFTPEQIAPLFKEAKEISNIHLPQSFWYILNKEEIFVKGFKGFDKNMKCRDFQYEFGKEYIHNGKVKHCEEGFHFCENPLDIFGYYPPSESRFSTVTGKGTISKDTQDSKVAASEIKIEKEISLKQVIEKGVEFILSKVDFNNNKKTNTGDRSAATNTGNRSAATNTGDSSAATNTGYRSAATNTGDSSAATNTGYRSAATNTGDRSAATNTGNRSAATNTGDRSAATNTGDRSAATNTGDSSAATNTGDSSAATNTGDRSAATVEGKNSAAFGFGINNKAKACVGSFIILTEWEQNKNYEWNIINLKSVKVDGKEIKANTFYKLENGKFIETI